jgi:hypothetical protein
MYKVNLHRAMRAGTLAVAVAASVAVTSPAWATGGSGYNHATLTLRGGAAQALSACVNYARVSASHHRPAQSNYCDNFAEADGGSVNLSDVSIFIDQEGHRRRSVNDVTIDIRGGDASAVAACVNYLQGTATPSQTNECSNTSIAQGGNVTLNNVDITVVQT